ncbi:hypothetical protein M0D45_20555 [Xanthomonas prunicola]|uniref:YiiX/YebB-like N1pC/P60 family cysteine hydrolase n=1 Tax=Xanthomonas prunicola TaxID=2053930 RepID=UPI0021B4B8A0|nr:YiiX/YebB-like N1pC/P60 family cysteine hydrolase [Xanthomonas prunicola]UXA52974.1 hypothetical protein M0D45_20555 [Xanthomonas prunicola]
MDGGIDHLEQATCFVLDSNRVEIGDVILTSEHQLRSKGIRAVTLSDYSHAMICVGYSSYIHAVGPGVEVANPQREGFDRSDRVCVLRYVGDDREILAKRAAGFARTLVGMEYSVPDALASKIAVLRKALTNRQYCSRLVAQAYVHAGVALVRDPDFCSPEDLYQSKHLAVVPNCLREANEVDRHLIQEERERAKWKGSEGSPLKDQAKMIKLHFEEARAITGLDLQTSEQIYRHLMLDDTHDRALSESLERSGYLTLWRVDVEKNPWRYDASVLLSMGLSDQQLGDVAARELNMAEQAIERYAQNASAILQMLQVADRNYFRLEQALYTHLCQLHSIRLAAAKMALAFVHRDGKASEE